MTSAAHTSSPSTGRRCLRTSVLGRRNRREARRCRSRQLIRATRFPSTRLGPRPSGPDQRPAAILRLVITRPRGSLELVACGRHPMRCCAADRLDDRGADPVAVGARRARFIGALGVHPHADEDCAATADEGISLGSDAGGVGRDEIDDQGLRSGRVGGNVGRTSRASGFSSAVANRRHSFVWPCGHPW